MAITKAQQAKQMLQDGGRIGLQGGGSDSRKDDYKTPLGISPGRSMAQFGHAGHAGKAIGTAKKHQREGRDIPDDAPSSAKNPFSGHTKNEVENFKPKEKKNIIKRYNEYSKKKNLEYITNLRRKKFKGIADKYGLTEEQLNMLLAGGGQLGEDFEGGRNLTFTGLQQLLDRNTKCCVK